MRTKLTISPARSAHIGVKNKSTVPASSVNMLSDYEKERLIQEHYGRKKLTLATANKPSEGEVLNIDGASKSRFISREESDKRTARKGSGKMTDKIQKSGHEACLAKAIYERRKVRLTTTTGYCVVGELLEFDKYSIRLRNSHSECMWYFKSALIGFEEVE